MQSFPIFLSVKDQSVLVVGGSEAAARKAELLLAAGARVTLIADTVVGEIAQMIADARISWRGHDFDETDLSGMALVIVATGDEAQWDAFTANWVTQVSFDPPLVAVSVENTSTSLPIIRRIGRFSINVFDATQRDLAGKLGKPFARSPEKLEGLSRGVGEHGTPVLLDGLAWIECELVSEQAAGDSTLVLGRVVGANVLRREEPLTMLAAGFKHAG